MRYNLNPRVKISPHILWPLFACFLGYLFFSHALPTWETPADIVGRMFRPSSWNLSGNPFNLVIGSLYLVFGLVVIVSIAFLAAWTVAAVISAMLLPFTGANDQGGAEASKSSLGSNRRLVSFVATLCLGIAIPWLPGHASRHFLEYIMPTAEMAYFLFLALIYILISWLLTRVYHKHQPVVRWEKMALLVYLGLCIILGLVYARQKEEWRKQSQASMTSFQRRMRVGRDQMKLDKARMEAICSKYTGVPMRAQFDESGKRISWSYRLTTLDGSGTLQLLSGTHSVALDTARITIVFVGVPYDGEHAGTIEPCGSGGLYGASGEGNQSLLQFNMTGVTMFSFSGHDVILANEMKTLTIDGKSVELGEDSTTIRVAKDGNIDVSRNASSATKQTPE